MRRHAYLPFVYICITVVTALVLDIDNIDSIRNAAALIAHGAQALYNGNQTGGVLGKWPYPPYYWWESGGAWGSMMQYQVYTQDMSYHNVLHEAVCSQLGKKYDFIMESEVFDTGNDDQAFWVFIAMAAAEHNYPAPPAPAPPWLQVVQNAFDLYVERWNTTMCGGGLKWQFNPNNNGFYYKQSISNGAFFQISARLARYTGNQTYVHWAEKIWDWSRAIGLVDESYHVFDGSDEHINCTQLDHHQWSYNAGVYLYGAAVLQNLTKSVTWIQRTTGLLDAVTLKFFSPFENSTNVIFEPECETMQPYACNTDQQSMKAYLIRWLAGTSQMAPFTAGRIGTLLRTSAQAAALACSGGQGGNTCGSRWYVKTFDGVVGLGQQISALEAVTALLVNQTAPPGTMQNVELPQQSQLPSTIAPASTSTSTTTTTTTSTTSTSTRSRTTTTTTLTIAMTRTTMPPPPSLQPTQAIDVFGGKFSSIPSDCLDQDAFTSTVSVCQE